MNNLAPSRRELVTAPLLAAAAATFALDLVQSDSVQAAGVDPSMTIIKPPDQIVWRPHYGYPSGVVDEAPMYGASDEPGQYFVLVRWHPGFMSAPHYYETDRLCVVLSGTWYVASGEVFTPDATVPVPAGSFVRRVARTPHYDGVRKGVAEPAVIAITGLGPIRLHLIDRDKPGWREL